MRDKAVLDRGIRNIILESSEAELREAFKGADNEFESLAARGKQAVERALAAVAAPEKILTNWRSSGGRRIWVRAKGGGPCTRSQASGL